MRVASMAMGLSMWIGSSGKRPVFMSCRRMRVTCCARPTANDGMSTTPPRLNVLVNGPTISSWATALTLDDVDPRATLCFNYDNLEGPPLPFLAINEDRNIVALNTFPPDAHDINKFWYQCQVGNAIQYAAGNRDKCRDERGCNSANPPPLPE